MTQTMEEMKILLVEDEADVQLINRGHLEEQGYIIQCATTLAEARTALLSFAPHLVLLDIMMPDGNGYDFCQQCCKPANIPVIFLTCLNEENHIVEGLDRGGDDYITKPYSLNVMSSRISAVLRRASRALTFAPGIIDIPPLSINLANARATLGDITTTLTQKELQLLALFAGHLGQAFSMDEIYEAVWDLPYVEETKTVPVHISRLRKKLGKSFAEFFEIICTDDNKYMLCRLAFMPEE